ncbi:hypothetical protein LG634_21385 [Streptomyces bambusae]|uniref:hypothetical protein n=1 Tax=Streptomyces bambusae TaxID=1550616 RepID=UPI001CFEA5BB|nr:hypothetical protein [Streptomyces bambusae]MCB5167380.1 hypothetical protein [Streptomyces bambusae]
MTNIVETGEDFRALLRHLSRRFEDLGAGAPEIDDILLRWAGALPDEGPDPGWQGLADQLLDALDAPSAGPAQPAPLGDEPPVSSPEELRVLLLALAADFARDRAWTQDRPAQGLWAGDGGGWASGSMAQFLESWEAWLDGSLGRPPAFPDVPPIEPVTWASVAWQLGAARVYE